MNQKDETDEADSIITALTPLYDPPVDRTAGEGQIDRRGRVQYVLSGERRFFHGWTTLVEYLEAKLAELDVEETS